MTTTDGPPRHLDGDLELDPATWTRTEVYRLLTALVVPRPVAWVSTLAPDGTRNLAPHSFFTVVAEEPPHVAFSSIGRKDTLRNVEATGEFTISIATMAQVAAVNASAVDAPPHEDEFTLAGVTAEPSRTVAAPRVAHAPAHLECRLAAVHQHGDGNLVVGEVMHVHVRPTVWQEGQVDPTLLDPVLKLGGPWYAHLGERTELHRPTWDDTE